MEKLGHFVAVKTLETMAWGKLHRGFWIKDKVKERALIYQIPLALQAPEQFPHHLAALDVLAHESVKGEFLLGHKYVGGFPLSMILARCERDGFPLPLDHALLIMERVLSGWEDYRLGLPHPWLVWMTFDGEVKCSALPLPRAFPRWKHDDLLPWLSPQVVQGQEWGRPDQAWAAGALFFQLLTGRSLPAGESEDSRVAAILQTPVMAEGPIPKDLQMILLKALASKPEERYQHIKDMREELGQLIYSGAYTPTTFNLAFFMHTLFREEVDGEEKMLAEEDALDLTPVLAPPTPPKPAEPARPASTPIPSRPTPSFAQAPEPETKRSPALFIGLAAAAIALIAAGVFLLRGKGEEPPPPAPTGQLSLVDLQKQKELEEKLAESQRQLEELQRTAQQQKDEMEKLLKAQKEGQKSPEIDKAIEQKRREAEALEAKLREAEQTKKAIQQQTQPTAPPASPVAAAGAAAPVPPPAVPASAPGASPTASPTPASQTPPAATPAAPEATAAKPEPPPATAPVKTTPAVKEGDLVPISEVDNPPVPIKKVPPAFPPIARMKKIAGKVTVKVLVNEKGRPDQVEVVAIFPPSNVGFDKAAVEAVQKWEFQPATKEGIRVKCWFLVPVVFD